ncbi:hypothetical protein F383_27347 [Gossypium arboreum]|uniref:Uncharacterized protein n=1 Tax=Gossypium arboreum TaxID=29729 RepID=A0A0B0PC11_GOSAR|nr:hypothetical protein F383_27347 [Gossypium arboreum]
MLEIPCRDIWPMRMKEDDCATMLKSPMC